MFSMDMERQASPLAAKVARKIHKEWLSAGTNQVFLPTERELTRRYGVARNTVRRALSLLIESGLVQAERSRGYRILNGNGGKNNQARIAVVQGAADATFPYGYRTSQEVADAMRRRGLAHGRQILNMEANADTAATLIRDLREANVRGVALTASAPALLDALKKANVGCVILENSERTAAVDYVFQDNFGGGCQAARHLLSRGHKRFGWVGPPLKHGTGIERWLGAQSAFMERGLSLQPSHVVATGQGAASDRSAIRAMLSAADRPSALLTLWQAETEAAVLAMGELGLRPGRDMDVAGWCTRREYTSLGMRVFSDRVPAAMVVWDSDAMADVAIERLTRRMDRPDLPPLHIAIPTVLMLPNDHTDSMNEPEMEQQERREGELRL